MTPITERRKRPKRRTIAQILDLMQEHADVHYVGDLYNHGLEIFLMLEEGDQKTFLRQSLILNWERQVERARSSLDDVVIDNEIRIDPVSVEKERMSIDELNQAELIRMRTWLYKFLSVVGVAGFSTMIAIFYFSDTDNAKANTLFEILTNTVELLVG